MIDYAYKEKFEQDSIHKDLLISYEGGSITNSELDGETFELYESLCSQNELLFGCCEASYVKFSVGYGTTQLEGKELTITTTPAGATPLSLGKYKVFSDTPTADRRWREILAYDVMYDILNTDITAWYDALFEQTPSMTLKIFRNSLFTHLGVTQIETTLINDDMIVEKTVDAKALTGKDILIPLCEINACFGRITRDGKFEYVYLKPPTQGLFPEVTLYPATDLYPVPDGNAQEIGKDGNYISAKYEDYVTDFITKVQIREEENDIGVIVGSGDNMYVIEDNLFVYGKGTDELTPIANNILNKVQWLYFCPAQIEAPGNPCLQTGDGVKLVTTYAIIETYILQRTLKGIQALKDSYVSESPKSRQAQNNTLQKQIIQLKGKSNVLERTIEETNSTITDYCLDGTNPYSLQSQITQNAGSISAEVTRAGNAESTITNSLNAEITRAQTREGQLSSSIQALPGSIMAQVQSTYETQGNVTTKVNDAISTAEGYTDTQLGNYYTKAQTVEQVQLGEGRVEAVVQSNYYNKTSVDGMIQGLQDQIDNRTTLWTVDAVPTLNNYPANQWTTTAEKDQHINDIALVSSADPQHAGENYRFEKTNNVYAWNIVQDTVATQALAKANEALSGVADINTDLQTNYYTQQQTTAQITLSEGRIKQSVQEDYELKVDVTSKVATGVAEAEGYTDNVLLSYSNTTETQSLIDQSADSIKTLVSSSLNTYSEENYDITLYGYGTPTADAATYVNKYYLNQSNGYLYLSDGSAWSKVDELDLISTELQTQITQNHNAIETKVSNGEISSKLSQEAGQITISANRLVIDSTGFKLDANGKAQFFSSDSTNIFSINDVNDQQSNYILRVQKYKTWDGESSSESYTGWADTFSVDKSGNLKSTSITVLSPDSSISKSSVINYFSIATPILRTPKIYGTDIELERSGNERPTLSIYDGDIYVMSGSSTFPALNISNGSSYTSMTMMASSSFVPLELVGTSSSSTTRLLLKGHIEADTYIEAGTYIESPKFKFAYPNDTSNYFEGKFRIKSSSSSSYYLEEDESGIKSTSTNDFTIEAKNNMIIKGNTSTSNTLTLSCGSIKIGNATSGRLGFFNTTPIARKTVSKLSSSATLAQTVTKVNDLLTALKDYGLISN